MPTAPAVCTYFTEISGEFVTSKRADVGIDPLYNIVNAQSVVK